MQNKKNRRQHTEKHRRSVRFEDLLEDDRFDDEDFDSVTDDTLEFLSLDDEMIESYQRTHPSKSGKNTSVKACPGCYEDEDYDEEDYEDEDYEDEDYDEEDYEDEDYEDEDYEDEDYDDEDYEYDDEDGFAARLMYFIGEMGALDVAVALLGVLVLVGAIATGGIYVHAKSVEKQVEAFADMGEELEGISVIGESGLLAASESAKLGGMIDVEEENGEEQEEAEEKDEKDEKGEVEVELHLTSILSDIKIKFVNKETGKLIGGVPFEVEVSGPKKFQLKDEDKDGVIYQKDIAAGTYEVKVLPLSDGAAEKYRLPSKGSSVKVTDKIAYQKVDVADEVKTEAEINVAKEEATQQNTVVESALKDTVEWVESTKTPIGDEKTEYEKVPMDKIADPWKSAGAFRKMVEDGGDDPYANVQVSINKDSLTLDKGESGSLKISVSSSEVEYSVEWSVADSSVATVSGGTVTAVAAGSTTVTARVAVGSMIQEFNCSVSVNDGKNEDSDKEDQDKEDENKDPDQDKEDENKDPDQDKDENKDPDKDKEENKDPDKDKEENKNPDKDDDKDKDKEEQTVYTKLSIGGEKEVAVGKKLTLTAETKPKGGEVVWSSDDEKIAKVNEKGEVTGVAEGEVKIRAVCKNPKDVEDIKESYKIKVVKAEAAPDENTKLKDKDGNQLYFKNADGDYEEATYKEYGKRDAFYKKVKGSSAYKYTGWQTIDGHVYFYDKNGNYVTGEQVIQGAKYSFGSDGKLAKSSGAMGIDVSKHNGNIDWNAVKNSGVSYVIIRCGYRGYSTGVLVEDPKFRSNIKGAKAAGLKVGAYFFSQAVNEVEAVEEASMAIDLVKGYGLNYPLFLDVEASGGRADGISRETRTAVCKTFCQTVQNSGIAAGIYANKTWFTEKINTASLTNYKLWLAQYASAPTYTATRYDLWQYSSKGKVSGISTNVDMNISYVSY